MILLIWDRPIFSLLFGIHDQILGERASERFNRKDDLDGTCRMILSIALSIFGTVTGRKM
jgi:hypothetical protein